MSSPSHTFPAARAPLVLRHTLALAICLLLPFTVHLVHLLNDFYARGADLCDTGLFATILWRPDLTLSLPSAFVDSENGRSLCALSIAPGFLSTHVSPWFAVMGLPTHFLDVGQNLWFSLVHAGMLSLLGGIAWIVLRQASTAERALPVAAMLALSLAFAFNGVVLASLQFPHFELLIPGVVLLAVLVLAERGLPLALAVIAAGMLLREDVGLHVAALAGTLALARVLDGGALRTQSRLIGLAIGGILMSIASMALQKALGGGGGLDRIYLGSPPFAHLDMQIMTDRLYAFWMDRAYVHVLLLGAVVHACWRRSWVPLAAAASCIPWTVLHLMAVKEAPAMFWTYYAFPWIAAYLWPILGERFIHEQTAPGRRFTANSGAAVWVTATLLVASAVGTPFYTLRNLVVNAIPSPSLMQAGKIEAFLRDALAHSSFENIIVAYHAAAVVPRHVSLEQVWTEPQVPEGDAVLLHERYTRPPRVGSLTRFGMKHCVSLPGTPWLLATRDTPPIDLVKSYDLQTRPLPHCDGTTAGR